MKRLTDTLRNQVAEARKLDAAIRDNLASVGYTLEKEDAE
jgi:hypothetical protein